MATDPNVGVPDADVVYGANVRVRAPEVCATCAGDEWVTVLDEPLVEVPCPRCACQICGSAYDVLNGVCGGCFDEADRYESRKESSR